MISVTTSYEQALTFAHIDNGGVVLTAEVASAGLLSQTLDGAGEWEHLAITSIEMTPIDQAPTGP